MKQKTILLILLFLGAMLSGKSYPRGSAPEVSLPQPFPQTQLPILFMQNKGQVRDQFGLARPDVLYHSNMQGIKVAITETGISYQFERKVDQMNLAVQTNPSASLNDAPMAAAAAAAEAYDLETYRIDMQLQASNPHPEVIAGRQNPYYENYYNIPSEPDGVLMVHAYESITLKSVYPGIDWVIYSHNGTVKYDFVVQPGADPGQIRIKYNGALGLSLTNEGALVLKTPLGNLLEDAPVTTAGNLPVKSQFNLADGILSFDVAAYDSKNVLTIDPLVRIWGTYYGGPSGEQAYSVAADAVGDVYIAGVTSSSTAIASGGHQNTFGGGTGDAFLAKFDSNGVRLWATFYGGTGSDFATYISLDGTSFIYMVGTTGSTTGIASGGYQNSYGGNNDAFLVKFNPSGLRQWATYIDAINGEFGWGTAVDPSGNVYISGQTNETGSMGIGVHQPLNGGNQDAFLIKFNSAGGRVWGTYYGGSGDDLGYMVAADPSGNVVMVGRTNSPNNIFAGGGHQAALGGGFDAFAVKFNSAGVRQWGTYYGGLQNENAEFCTAVDGSGNIYLSGQTLSSNNIGFGGHQNTFSGTRDGFLVKFDPAGARQWGTYYGANNITTGEGCAVDAQGNVYLAGQTNSTTGIAYLGHQNFNSNSGLLEETFLAKFNSLGVRQWGTYYGGTGMSQGRAVATDGFGAVYCAGVTDCAAGIASGGFQNTCGTSIDGFLAKFRFFSTNSAPVVNCQNLTTTANGNCQAIATAIQFDNGSTDPDNDPLTFTVSPTGPFSVGTTNVVLSVSDGQGNTTTCNAAITITDAQAPAISCLLNNITGTNDLNFCSRVVTYTAPIGTDNCPGVTTTQTAGLPSGAAFPVGSTTNTFRATDGAGNTSTCSFTVTVTDAQVPAITCPPNISGTNDLNLCSKVVTYSAPTGTDNCPGATTIQTTGLASGATFPIGATTNTFRVTDASGNSTTCSFTITVTDTQAPAAICQPVTVTLDPNGNGSTTAAAVNNGSTDNCTISTTTLSQTAFTCANAGTNTVTLTVTDASGNTSTCTATVTVLAQPVTLSAQASTAQCGYNITCANATDGTATPTGGCPPYTYNWSTGATTATITSLGAGTYTVTVTDGAGGTATQTITLTAPTPLQATAISTPTCDGSNDGSIDLTVTGGNDCQPYTFEWVNGETTEDITSQIGGNYYVTITDTAGCTQSLTPTIVTLASPQPTFTQSGNLLTCNQTWSSYQWIRNGSWIPGANDSTYTVTQSGNYYVSVTDTNGCTGTSLASMITGIQQSAAQWDDLILYPNPARGTFHLRFPNPIPSPFTAQSPFTVKIADIYGKQLQVTTLPALDYEATFDITHLAAGTYWLQVDTDPQYRKRFRLVVQ